MDSALTHMRSHRAYSSPTLSAFMAFVSLWYYPMLNLLACNAQLAGIALQSTGSFLASLLLAHLLTMSLLHAASFFSASAMAFSVVLGM